MILTAKMTTDYGFDALPSPALGVEWMLRILEGYQFSAGASPIVVKNVSVLVLSCCFK